MIIDCCLGTRLALNSSMPMFFEYRPSGPIRLPASSGPAVLYNYRYSPTRLGLFGVERETILPMAGFAVNGGLHYIGSDTLKSLWRTEPHCVLITVDVVFDGVTTSAYTLRRRDPVQGPGILMGSAGVDVPARAA